MIKRILLGLCCVGLLTVPLTGCGGTKEDVKIGVSFGVGSATRWVYESECMKARAEELGADIEVRLNTTDKPKTQNEDCIELIDSGIDVLILTPRDVNNVGEILAYAKEKNVKVISYARVVLGQKVDLFVGYDSGRIGQTMGQFLTEMVYQGDYIILSGDPGDNNATLLYEGAMRSIEAVKDDVNIILDKAVAGWSPDEAKRLVKEAVAANGNKVDGILAPNDKLAGACVEALEELGVTKPVVITGMDAELDAAKRIVADKQSMTVYMDLKVLASTAVEEAVHMAKGETVNVNAEFDNQTDGGISANLISGQQVTKQNLDKILIESGYYTHEQVYGE